MISEFLNNPLLNLFIFFVINFFVFFLINFILLKKNLLIDEKAKSPHKQLVNNELVPISGGIILLINCFFFNFITFSIALPLIIGIYLIGLLADIQRFNSPLRRLFLQSLLILIFVSINEVLIRSIRLEFFDIYLNIDFVSILFTSFCLLILINGSNFIDGVNLQCSGYYFVVLSVLIYLNSKGLFISNILDVSILYSFLFCFICFNFFNKSYLGDGGSYLLSFIIGIFLIKFQSIHNISPYFIVLILWYPAFENFFSIIRRTLSKTKRADEPDLNHFHHLLYKYLKSKFKIEYLFSFSLPGIIINLFNFIIFFIGANFIYSTSILILLIFICISVYLVCYFYLKKNIKII